MRQFNTEGLNREALQQIYEVTVTHKLVGEAKIERLKREIAVALCAIEDGKCDLEQIKIGLKNLFLYCESHTTLEDELKDNEEKFKNIIQLDEALVKELTLEQLSKKMNDIKNTMNTPPSGLKIVH